MSEQPVAEHYIYAVGSMSEDVVLGKSENELVNVNYRNAYRQDVQGRYTAVYKHFIDNDLRHNGREYAEYLHRENCDKNKYELTLEFQYRGNEPLEAENSFSVENTLFIYDYSGAVPHLRKLVAPDDLGSCLVRLKYHELVLIRLRDDEEFAVISSCDNGRINVFKLCDFKTAQLCFHF